MSDKSKLGFNINPKNYDELNSTDNLITSGSDSGWLGKKLQGNDSNDLDLSKINPLFDKDLYEKYRPGVNTNDGSVNQDIWGYKCFNSPVSFRNGIYGDTYSIKSIEGIEDSIIHKTTYNGVSTAVNDNSHVADKDARDNVRYSYNLTTELLTAQEKSYIASTYTGKLRRALNAAVRPTYDLFKKEPRVYGSSIENETSVSGDIRSNCFWLYTYCNPDKTKLNIYNGINVYSSNAPTQYINERNEINIASTIFNDDNTGTAQDIEHTYSESRVTVGTDCKEDIVIKDYTSASGNCIRMYSTNGRYNNAEYINDNISSIVITSPEASSENFPSIDMHVAGVDGGESNIIIKPYSIELKSTNLGIAEPYINIDSDNNTITLHAATLNLPTVTVSNALFADRAGIASDAQAITYINSDTLATTKLLTADSENIILPSGNKEISIGNNDHRLKSVYAENFYGTATKAERDRNNNIITDTYFKLDSNNTITGLNYIKGAGEHIRFTDYSGSTRIFTSIATSYADNYHEYCTNLRWSNNDETAFIVCGLKLQISYDPNSDSGEFQILPHVYTDSTSQDITMRMVLGSKDEPLSSIYCNEFPTLYKTIACSEDNTNNLPSHGTAIGNIRLLCIVLPAGQNLSYQIIYPGYKFTGTLKLGNDTYHVRLARFNAYNTNNSVMVLPINDNDNDVEGKWLALSGADVGGMVGSNEGYVPILAMRVE